MLYVPTSGRDVVTTMRKAFGKAKADARRCAREYLAEPFYTFVVFHRILHGREKPNDWRIVEKNNADVSRLRRSGRSFIVATGHFRRESFLAQTLTPLCPGGIAIVPVPLPGPSLRPHDILERLRFGQYLKVFRYCRPDAVSLDLGGSVRRVLKHLGEPGSQLIMSADAFWRASGGSAYTRPFAGMKARPFSTGTAALSRLSQCPILPCAGYVESNGTVVLEWGALIEPPARDNAASDKETTDKVLEFLEQAIGRRPTQYVLYIGEERQWNPNFDTWDDPDESVSRRNAEEPRASADPGLHSSPGSNTVQELLPTVAESDHSSL
jgi:lauroyl/myristoyl acyltransferase